MDMGKVGVAVIVVLVTTSLFAPTVTAASGDTTFTNGQTAGETLATQSTTVDIGDDPAVVLKLRALEQLQSLNDSDRIDRANESISGTLSQYRDLTRVTSGAVFTNDSRAVRLLAGNASTDTDAAARQASVLLAAADNASARQAITDAERVLDIAREEIDHPGTLRSSEAHLTNAQRAYDRGLDALTRAESATDRRAFTHRAQAIEHFRQAWIQSELVLQRLDESLAPEVTITDRSDPIRENATNRTISASVRVVDPASVGNATILVDGVQQAETNVSTAGVGPGENASVQASVRLPDRTANVTVVVDSESTTVERGPAPTHAENESDTDDKGGPPAHNDSEDGDRGPPANAGPGGAGNGGPPADAGPGDDDRQTNSPTQRASATLLLDGDGLNDTYEQDVLGTDPLDSDSDAAATSADEANNGIIDGKEDFDADNLTTLRELELGTDPLDADTDGDDLDDGVELWLTQTDPLESDTDDDGTPDGQEDPDGDGLTNAEEIDAGSFPRAANSDGDGWNDGQEVANGTNPLAADTDGDGLDDDVEPTEPFETDPTDPDTDGDGVLDGNETYTGSERNESLGVTVDVTGEGDVVASTDIEKPTHARYDESSPLARNVSVAEGPFASFETEGEIDNATLTFEYNESQVSSNESAVSVYRFNESIQTYERVPSRVDPATNTVSAETDHFSTYTVMDSGAWQRFLQRLRNARVTNGSTGTSVIFEEDFEGLSVANSSWTCSNEPRGGRYKDTPTKGYCEIDDGWATVQEETNRKRTLTRNVSLNVPADASVLATARFKAHIDAQWSQASLKMVMSSDDTKRTIAELNNDWSGRDRTIDTVTTANVSEFAGETVTLSLEARGRHTYRRQNTTSWISVENITITGGQPQDKDGDGISDLQEKQLPLRNYGIVNLSTDLTDQYPSRPKSVPKGRDTDGDGLPDGVEVITTSKIIKPDANPAAVLNLSDDSYEGINLTDRQQYINESALVDSGQDGFYGYPWLSNPTKKDTDGDDLTDWEEVEGQTVDVINKTLPNGSDVPYRWAPPSEANGTATFTSDPRTAHSDDDSLSDSEERDLKTDPMADRTYYLTTEHEQLIENTFGGSTVNSTAAQLLNNQLRISGVDPQNPTLTDATDDFDLVLTDGSGWGRFLYTPTGGNQFYRTDRWVSNTQEREYLQRKEFRDHPYQKYETDPWDPDTDDDGLTDGQEMYGITADSETYRTDPTDPDTDGDGYWDGWIGVHGVGYSDNVILYQQNLQTGDGIEGDEIVQAQVGVHHVDEVASAGGADIDSDGQDEHSNVHIGELQWGTDPTDDTDKLDEQFEIEADFLEGPANQELNTPEWERGIEDNFALYGIDIEMNRDDKITTPDGNFDIIWAAKKYFGPDKVADESHDLYLMAGGSPIDPLPNSDATGVNIQAILRTHDEVPGWARTIAGEITDEAHMVFTENINAGAVADPSDYHQTPYTSELQLVSAGVELHELGHSFHIGEADDTGPLPAGEVYSGDNDDDTPENLYTLPADDWSIMRSYWEDDVLFTHNGAAYHVFSIEELTTVSEP